MKRFLFQDGPRSRRPQDGKSAALVIGALFLIIGCLFTACPMEDSASRTATPATAAASQADAVFTLSSPPYAVGTTWKVYAADGQAATGVSANYSRSTNTLTLSGTTPGQTYYVSATEPGKTESGRLALTVEQLITATPTTSAAIVPKTTATQESVEFTLNNDPAHAAGAVWKVYPDATGDVVLDSISASCAANTLTLTHATDVPVGPYYVSATETNKIESGRLQLTVAAVGADVSTPAPTTDTASITKSDTVEASVVFTLTNSPAYEAGATWKVYIAATGIDEAEGVSASYDGAANTLTLSHDTDIPAGTYYVSAANPGKNESARLALTINEYLEFIDHTQPNNEEKTDPGLYVGARELPLSSLDTLDKAFTWIAANAEASGKYRYVPGANEDQAAKTLDAAAFHSVSGVVITLAGGAEERTIQLTGTGSLYKLTVAGNTLRLGANITLKGVTANTEPLVAVENGTLVMEADSKITANTNSTANGAGVRLSGTGGAAFTMNGGEISECKNTNGSANAGGVYMHGGNATSPVFTMNNGTISGNTGSFGGGVNVSNGVFTMFDGSITGNNAGTRRGGGVLVGGNATFTMKGGTISGNTATGSGGGVTVEGHATNTSAFIMEGGTIAGNTVSGATGTGGGVHINVNGAITKTGGTIYGSNETTEGLKNTATNGPAVYIVATPDPLTALFARKTTLTGHLTKAQTDTAAIPAQDNTGVATVTIAADGSSGRTGDTSSRLTFIFTQAVAGFTAANFTLTGAADSLPTLGAVSMAASPNDGTVWEALITPATSATIGAVIDYPGVTLNPVTGIQVHVGGPTKIISIEQVGGASTITASSGIKIVFGRKLVNAQEQETDLQLAQITLTSPTNVPTLDSLTKDTGTDPSGATYTLALSSVTKEMDITLTFTHDDIATTGTPAANVKTVRVCYPVTHTEANITTVTAPGLYAGAMDVPVQFATSPANTGTDLLTKAFAWIAANAVQNGKYRIMLGADANQAAKALNAAAFGSKTGVTITLAGDTAERTIQLTGVGQLYNITGGTLKLGNYITLKGVTANSGGVLIIVDSTAGSNIAKLIMETGSKITGNTNSNTAEGTTGGGGVMLRHNATFDMSGGTISENKFLAGNSAGVYLRDGATTFNMTGGEITANQGKWVGGVMVINSGTFNMSGGSIHHNSATSWGGGVGINTGTATFTMSGTAEISANTAPNGGGVYVGNSTLTMSGSAVIKGNTASGDGGGVYIATNGKIAKTGGIIYGGNESGDGLKNTASANKGAAVFDYSGKKREDTLTTAQNLVKTGESAFTGNWDN